MEVPEFVPIDVIYPNVCDVRHGDCALQSPALMPSVRLPAIYPPAYSGRQRSYCFVFRERLSALVSALVGKHAL